MGNYGMNPLQLLSMLKSGNPQKMAMSLLQQNMGNTPLGANLANLAKQGNTEEIEKIARNICAQKGINYDTEFANFKQMLNIK